MAYLVDTNIISFAMRGRHGVEERLYALPVSTLRLSAIVQAEGWAGARKTSDPERWLRLWRGLVGRWPVVPFDTACADQYARIRADLERRGCMIGLHDCEIAATALAYGLVVVTDNDAEFNRVAGLDVENWVQR